MQRRLFSLLSMALYPQRSQFPRRWPRLRLALPLFFLLTFHALPTAATDTTQEGSPTVQEVIERSIDALGGADRWQAVKSLEITGTFSTFSTTHPFRIRRERPNLYRFDHREADQPVTIGFDGERSWWQNPFPWAGVPWATAPSIIYHRGFEADAEFVFPFLDHQERGHQPALLGRENYEGIDAYVLEMTLSNGTVERWYIDAETYLPAAREADAGYVGRPSQSRSFFSDYQTVEGIQIPFATETELGNRISEMLVGEVTLNPQIPQDVFRFPLSAAMERLQNLTGDWRVKLSARLLPTLPWFEAETTSTITASFDGRVLEENIAYLSAGLPRQVKRIYSFDRFRENLKIIHLDDLNAYPMVLVADAAADPIQATAKDPDSHWEVMGRPIQNRLILKDLQKDHFQIDWEASFDGGQNWAPLTRFEYQRMTTEFTSLQQKNVSRDKTSAI